FAIGGEDDRLRIAERAGRLAGGVVRGTIQRRGEFVRIDHEHRIQPGRGQGGGEACGTRPVDGEDDARHARPPTGTTESAAPPVTAASTSPTTPRSTTSSSDTCAPPSMPSSRRTSATVADATRMRGCSYPRPLGR